MNLFAETERLFGEKFVSAVLRYLLTESTECRKAFSKVVAERANITDFGDDKPFCCERERQITDEKGGIRFLDLLIKTEQVVIGIEIKLAAGFTEDQPRCYVAAVSDLASTEGRISPATFCVLVIAPELRTNEIMEHIRGDKKLKFLSWTAVLDAIKASSDQSSSKFGRMVQDFCDYVAERSYFLPNFLEWLESSRMAVSAPNYSDSQRMLIQSLKVILRSTGVESASGASWYGFYFCTNRQDSPAWVGYLNKKHLLLEEKDYDPTHESELVVILSQTIDQPDEGFVLVRLSADMNNFLYLTPMKLHAWMVSYDSRWHLLSRWHAAFAPLLAFCPRSIEIATEPLPDGGTS